MNFHSEIFQWLEQRKQGPHHRQLLVLAGDEQWGIQTAKSIIQVLNENSNSAVLSVAVPNLGICITNNKYRQFLGQEFSALIYNAWQGIRANALSALTGTVQKDGLMLLLCPPFDSWPAYKDPELSDRISFGYVENFSSSYFVKWLIQKIESDNDVAVVSENILKLPLAPVSALTATSNTEISVANVAVSSSQKSAIDAVIKVAIGHRCRPLILEADRGRGKSATLGIAAAYLTTEHKKQVLISASHPSQCTQAMAFFELAGGDSSLLRYCPIDKLIDEQPNADIVLIDEAATIPNNQLSKVCDLYKRLVFSTTIHGYEGSGKGFEIRFKPQLIAKFPLSTQTHLSTPLRWYDGDALERFWFNLFCQLPLTHEASDRDSSQKFTSKYDCYSGYISQQQLIESQTLLHDVFTLLIEAHYQTSPDTLSALLEAPNHDLFVIVESGKVVATALTAREGGEMLVDLAPEISAGKRRPNGHLLAQKMCYLSAEPTFATYQYRRIVRIAVCQQHRRKGLASKLVNVVESYDNALTSHEKATFLGASFGLDITTLQFWKSLGFQLVDVGYKRETNTGEFNALVLRSMPNSTDIEQTHLTLLTQRFKRDFLFQLSRTFQTMDVGLVKQIWLSCFQPSDDRKANADLSGHNEYSDKELMYFSSGKRTLDISLQAIHYHCINTLNFAFIDEQEAELVIAYVLQNQAESVLQKRKLITGKKDLQDKLRKTIAKLI